MWSRDLPQAAPPKPLPDYAMKRGLPAWARGPAPEPAYSQEEKRTRRRRWQRIEYRADFDLTAEMRALLDPPAAAMTELTHPLGLRDNVSKVAAAVYDLTVEVISIIGSRPESAVRTFAAVERDRDRDDLIVSHTWAADLAAIVEPFAAALSGALASTTNPDARGETASERLISALRVVDTAVGDLQNRVALAHAAQTLGPYSARKHQIAAQRAADRAARRAIRLGVKP